MTRLSVFSAALALSVCAILAGCRSYHVHITVENRTGAPVQLLEVDYPNASFGVDSLAPRATYHYLIQVQGSGPVKVQYSSQAGAQKPIAGPALVERQQGSLWIVLLPGDKALFFPKLTAAH